MAEVPFNWPAASGRELEYLAEAASSGELSGNGPFTARCAERLRTACGAGSVFMTPSGTAALELAAILSGVGAGDEVIMPSFTFTSTANAFVLRGAVPVFVDVREDTLNLDEEQIAEALTPRTRAIAPVHYAGVACEMDAIAEIARRNGLLIIEDAAHALFSSYRGAPVGSIGDAAAFSFHETKNVFCGEGGALLVNREEWIEPAEIVQDKGANRRQFFRGEVDKYTWVDAGSSFLLSELNAAFLLAQLERADELQRTRRQAWTRYHEAFEELELEGRVRRPMVPDHCSHNSHLYYLLARDERSRDALIRRLLERGVHAVFHYVPLHSSSAGKRYGRTVGQMTVTDGAGQRLVRLPLWSTIDAETVEVVVDALLAAARED